jgi:eukaryotic-like serine/threonine-protein kinase
VPLSQRVPGRVFPPLLDQIMDRALAKKAEDRYASAADFAQAMQMVLQGATQLPLHLMPQREMETIREIVPQPMAQPRPPSPPQPVPSQPQMPNGPMQGGPMVAQAPRPLPVAPTQRPQPKSNVALLIGVAFAFLLLGVGLAVMLMKFVVR